MGCLMFKDYSCTVLGLSSFDSQIAELVFLFPTADFLLFPLLILVFLFSTADFFLFPVADLLISDWVIYAYLFLVC